jgi:hypothetical protein
MKIRIVLVAATMAVVASGSALVPRAAALPETGSPGTANKADQAAIRKAVCDRGVSANTCRVCPTYTAGVQDFGDIRLGPLRVGAFTTPGATEAYVSVFGCEARPNNLGGSVLLRKTGRAWKVVRYDAGLLSSECLRFPYESGTTLLTCTGFWAGQGYLIESIVAVYLGPTKTNTKLVMQVQDNEGSCERDIAAMSISAWRVVNAGGPTGTDLELTVTEGRAERTSDDCLEEFSMDGTRHRVRFVFDGVRFSPAAADRALFTCLSTNESVPARRTTSFCA